MGISGRDTQSSRVLSCLGHVAGHIRNAKLSASQSCPDFAFINFHFAEQSIGDTAAESYARTLLHLRWVSQRAAILGSQALQAFEAAELTPHSMKSSMLANAAQILMSTEHRLNQGRHRDIALLSSRNDTFRSLHMQGTVSEAVWQTVCALNEAGHAEHKRRSQSLLSLLQRFAHRSKSRVATSEP